MIVPVGRGKKKTRYNTLGDVSVPEIRTTTFVFSNKGVQSNGQAIWAWKGRSTVAYEQHFFLCDFFAPSLAQETVITELLNLPDQFFKPEMSEDEKEGNKQ